MAGQRKEKHPQQQKLELSTEHGFIDGDCGTPFFSSSDLQS